MSEKPILRAGVMGWPVSHSLSPKLHGRWIQELHLHASYEALPVEPHHLEESFRTLPKQGFRGWNLTVPHKEAAFSLVHTIDAEAHAIGAINTVAVQPDGTLIGLNTDAFGFSENLKEKTGRLQWSGTRALVLGAGGAARAVVYALKTLGIEQVRIANRTRERAEALVSHPSQAVGWEDVPRALEDTTLLINTTTLGMKGQPPLEIDITPLPTQAVVADIVYSPLETELLKAARARGLQVVTGLGMLIHQARPAFAAWFGAAPHTSPELETWLLSA